MTYGQFFTSLARGFHETRLEILLFFVIIIVLLILLGNRTQGPFQSYLAQNGTECEDPILALKSHVVRVLVRFWLKCLTENTFCCSWDFEASLARLW